MFESHWDRTSRDDWEVRRLLPENDNVTIYVYIELIYVIEGWYVLSMVYKHQVNTLNSKEITANNNNTVMRTRTTPAYKQVTLWQNVFSHIISM